MSLFIVIVYGGSGLKIVVEMNRTFGIIFGFKKALFEKLDIVYACLKVQIPVGRCL